MARARNLKPGFFRDVKLLELSPLTRLLFAGLWTVADRDGRLEDNPKQIQIDVLPCDPCDVGSMLQELANAGFIIRYESCNKRYLQVKNWHKHQAPHAKEQASTIPAPTLPGTSTGNSGASSPLTLFPLPSSLNPEPLTPCPELDVRQRFEEMRKRHPGTTSMPNDCWVAYQNLVVSASDPHATAARLDELHARWIAFWSSSGRMPLGLMNYLRGGDCMAQPPPIPAPKKSRVDEQMERIANS